MFISKTTKYYKINFIKTIVILGFLVCQFISFGQDDKVRLAYQYYQDKEYQKAAILFEELYEQSNAQVYFSYSVNCLIEINDFQQAEKLIKKQIRKNKSELTNYIELGYLYKRQNNHADASKQYDYVLKNLPPDKNEIVKIANNFLMKREYDYAQFTYEKGAKIVNYGFQIELANTYAYQRKSQEMVDAYLDLLKQEPAQIEMVQNNLQARMSGTFDENLKDIIKLSLVKRIQKDPKDLIYSEMLLWYYIQLNDYTNAIIQAKALDKKLKEGGMRLIELGSIAKSNNMFTEAKSAYDYVMSYGKESVFYFEAKLGYLEVYSEQIELGQITDRNELLLVEKMYIETIDEFNSETETINLKKDLAHLQAFYLNKSESAKQVLQDAVQNPKLNSNIKGSCKTELGDIYLMCGQVSDAILEYAQAAKMNDDNEIGDMAKLKRATLAFYTGNFTWAQAQLDVLKAGTSKLIANDAFVLSILISDNLGDDTTETALKYFAKAEMFLQQKKTDEALKLLDTLEIQYNTHSLIDDVLFLKSKIYEKQCNLDKTVQMLSIIAEKYAHDLLGDDAIYKLAQIYDYQLNDKNKAIEYYKKIIFDYSGSIYVVEARKRFRILRGDNASKSEKAF
jgi:predicted negative regulator of RcsB-dependent stress response